MGVCYSGSYTPVTIQTTNPKNPKTVTSKTDPLEINFSNSNTAYKLEPEFEDMPEWEGERYKGYGIKRMKGYKCDLKIDELNKKREKFWASKKNSKQLWKVIHQACVFDYQKAEEYLIKNNMTTLNGCINICKDSDNNLYYIPNFCINDPFFEKEILPFDESKNKTLAITLMDGCNNRTFKVEVKENIKGIDIKKLFANKTNLDLSEYNIKLLFGGGIIKDDEYLYQHKLKNGSCIQICMNKK